MTVQYTTSPTISTHGNVIAEATSASGAVVTYTNATATDAVGVTAITYSQVSGTLFPIGTTLVTIYASDAAHNTNTSTFTVTVRDTIAPVVATHADVTVAATSTNGAVVTYAAGSATDVVGVTSITYSQNSGTTFPIGLTTVTISAKDAANNTGTTTFNVRVIDFSGDVAQFRQCWRGLPNSTFQQWAFSVANDPSSVPAERVTNSFGTPTASLALGAFSEGYIDADPYFGPVQGIWDLGQYGTLTLNIPNQSGASTNSCKYVQVQVTQYKDGSIYSSNAVVSIAGGTRISQQQVTNLTASYGGVWVVEKTLWRLTPSPATESVVLTGAYFGSLIDQVVVDTLDVDYATPANIVATANAGLCGKTNVTWIMPTVDGCVVTNVTSTPPSGSTFVVGTTPVTYVAKDGEGGVKTFNFTVTITDDEPPVVRTQNTTVTLDATGHAAIVAAAVDNGSSDNCAIASRVVTPNTFTCANKGTNVVTLVVTDVHGNSATNSATVNVIDTLAPTVTAGTIATYYATTNAAQAAAIAATTASDNCDVPTLTACTVGTCSAVVTVTATDTVGNHASVTYNTRIDNQPPVIAAVTATNNSQNVKNGAATTLQGAVNFSVTASDNCSLGSNPAITLTNGAATATATYVSESPSGTFNYVWNVTSATANGTWNVTVTANDSIYVTTTAFTLVVNKNQVTGQVQLDSFDGSGTIPAHTRAVTFIASTNWVVGHVTNTLTLLTNTLTLTFSGDTAPFTLTGQPGNANGLSAKTCWNLRRKLPLAYDGNSQGAANFTGSKFLPGGDLDGDNQVMLTDYTLLANNFYTYNAVADFTGDGSVDYYDYYILYIDWFTAGDPQ